MNPTGLIIALFGIALGCFFLLMGKHALLSQDDFLRLYNRWQKTAQFGVRPFDVGYFGGPKKLRLLGVGLIVIGLFIVASIVAIALSHSR
jgi:multisubunit Na+/H+ antiporter MnhG subunit